MRKRRRGGKRKSFWNTNLDFLTQGTMLISQQPAKRQRPVRGWDSVPGQPNGSSKEPTSVVCLFSRRPQEVNLDACKTSSLYILHYILQGILCQHFHFSLGWVCTMSLFELLTDHQKSKLKEAKAIQISNEITKNENAFPSARSPDWACFPTSRLLFHLLPHLVLHSQQACHSAVFLLQDVSLLDTVKVTNVLLLS